MTCSSCVHMFGARCIGAGVCMGVAQPHEYDLVIHLFTTYNCSAISLRTMGLHELHQHALHMAAYKHSNLREVGYYYLPLSRTGTRYEGDAVLFNPDTKYALIIQFKAKLQGNLDAIDVRRLLLGYGNNSQLLSYSFIDVSAYAHLCKHIAPQLHTLYNNNVVKLPLMAYIYDPSVSLDTPQGESLEKGVLFYHDMMPLARYEHLKQCYYAQPQLIEHPELYLQEVQPLQELHAAVIVELATGITACLQNKVLLLPQEM